MKSAQPLAWTWQVSGWTPAKRLNKDSWRKISITLKTHNERNPPDFDSYAADEVGLSDNAFMPIQVAAGETDDPQFISLLNSLVGGLIEEDAPQEVWIIQIDNWFDHKWLRFSGIGTVDFQFPAFMNRYDAALDEFYQDKVTFPPFTPNRVLGQWSFVRVDDHYSEAPMGVLPHPSKKQPSQTNLHRRVASFSRSACFVWYSAKTLANGKASVMVYSVAGDRVEAWFAAFNRHQGWKLHATKGATQEDVQQLLNAR